MIKHRNHDKHQNSTIISFRTLIKDICVYGEEIIVYHCLVVLLQSIMKDAQTILNELGHELGHEAEFTVVNKTEKGAPLSKYEVTLKFMTFEVVVEEIGNQKSVRELAAKTLLDKMGNQQQLEEHLYKVGGVC